MGDIILLYRCWALWGRAYWIIALPLMTAVAGFGVFHSPLAHNAILKSSPRLYRTSRSHRSNADADRFNSRSFFCAIDHRWLRATTVHQCHGHHIDHVQDMVHVTTQQWRQDAGTRQRAYSKKCYCSRRREWLTILHCTAHIRHLERHRAYGTGDCCTNGCSDLCRCPRIIRQRFSANSSQGISPTLIIIRVGLGIAMRSTDGGISSPMVWAVPHGTRETTFSTGCGVEARPPMHLGADSYGTGGSTKVDRGDGVSLETKAVDSASNVITIV